MGIVHGIMPGQEGNFEEKVQAIISQATDVPMVQAIVLKAAKALNEAEAVISNDDEIVDSDNDDTVEEEKAKPINSVDIYDDDVRVTSVNMPNNRKTYCHLCREELLIGDDYQVHVRLSHAGTGSESLAQNEHACANFYYTSTRKSEVKNHQKIHAKGENKIICL